MATAKVTQPPPPPGFVPDGQSPPDGFLLDVAKSMAGGGGRQAAEMAVGSIPGGQMALDVLKDPAGYASQQLKMSNAERGQHLVNAVAQTAPMAASMLVPGSGVGMMFARTGVVGGTAAAADVIRHYATQALGTEKPQPFSQVAVHAAVQGGLQMALEAVPGVISKGASAVVGSKYLGSPEVRKIQQSAMKFGIKPGAPMQASVDSAVDATLNQIQTARTQSGVVGGC